MWGILHSHYFYLSMIVYEINIFDVAIHKAKNHPPITRYINAVKTFQLAFKLVQFQPRNIYIINGFCAFQQSQDFLKSLYKGLHNALTLVLPIQSGKPFVLYAANHTT